MYNLQEAYLGVYYDLDEAIDSEGRYYRTSGNTPSSNNRTTNTSSVGPTKPTKSTKSTKPSPSPSDAAAERRKQIASKMLSNRTDVPENYDLYDLIFDYLLDEGYADTEEAATVIMANMSEDWIDDICEEVLDEAHQIMSVNRDGKEIYKVRRSQLDRPSNELSSHEKKRRNQLIRARRNADRRGDDSPARERAFDRFVSGTDTPFNRIRTSNIKKLNAPTDPDKYGDNDPYHTVKTDYRARRRRASGR